MKIKFRTFHGIAPAVALAILAAPSADVMAAQAANALFDSWSVSSGTITSTIPGATTLVKESGLLQESFTDDNGVKLFHTVITEATATGTPGVGAGVPYSDESFVRQDQVSGILSQQQISTTTAAVATVGANDKQAFSPTSKLSSGWANATITGPSGNCQTYAAANGVAADVDISQTVQDYGKMATTTVGVVGDEFSNVFGLLITKNASGTVTGTSTSLNQGVGMGPDGTGVQSAQTFRAKRLTGTANTGGTGSITLGANPAVTFAAGDDVMLTWIGQQTNTTGAGTLGTTQTLFGFEGVTKTAGATVTTATVSSIADVGFDATGTAAGGFAWDTLFGTAPVSGDVKYPVLP